jgi:hypothetical protein
VNLAKYNLSPIDHSMLEKGQEYFFKSSALGEAMLLYHGGAEFEVTEGMLKGRKRSWRKGDTITIPNPAMAGNFYERMEPQ